MPQPPIVIVKDLKTYRAEDVLDEYLEAIARELGFVEYEDMGEEGRKIVDAGNQIAGTSTHDQGTAFRLDARAVWILSTDRSPAPGRQDAVFFRLRWEPRNVNLYERINQRTLEGNRRPRGHQGSELVDAYRYALARSRQEFAMMIPIDAYRRNWQRLTGRTD